MKVGIVGLPNVGKSTIFNAMTTADIPANNYPFCTIEPNMGIVNVPDERLAIINKYIKSSKIISTAIEFVDIAGLVKGASTGEGLGNKFLAHIRNVDAIVHVIRCFQDDDITHVEGDIDPLRDIQIIETELLLKDLERLNKRIIKIHKLVKSGNKEAKLENKLLETAIAELNVGNPLNNFTFNITETKIVKSWFLLTDKPIIYLCNISESELQQPTENNYYTAVKKHALSKNINYLKLCGSLEMEISKFTNTEDKNNFLEAYNLQQPGLFKLISLAYKQLGLITFFTAGEQEIRAWSIPQGLYAPQAAGTIHSDFERGFIKAEIYNLRDLVELKSENNLRENGKIRQEGKEYKIQDGDIIFFKFNV